MTSKDVVSVEQRIPLFLLASVLAAYPGPQFEPHVRALIDEPGLLISEALKNTIVACLNPSQIDDLRSEYIDVFERGRGSHSLYETEYGRARALVKGSELADISGFYHAFGFELSSVSSQEKEMLDHVAVELEFYSLLLMKQCTLEDLGNEEGVSIVLDARKKFLQDHLGRFTGAITQRPQIKASAFYSQIFSFCDTLVSQECQLLDVGVVPATWLDNEKESSDEVQCSTNGENEKLVQLG